ncbi:MAG: N-acetyltransferase [Citrobacter freundii]|nr:MAG: N-acetyltransferase [Citrobacter freundii]
MKNITVRPATEEDSVYAVQIVEEMFSSAIIRGSGISRRTPASIIEKMKVGKAVIALNGKNEWVGFSYLEVWANGEFVSNSGLIVSPAYRGQGIAKAIKKKIFELSRKIYPDAKIFSITTGLAIMQMNARLGFLPVTYSEIPQEEAFWKGCKSCVNYSILEGKGCKNCLCTAMLFKPGKTTKKKKMNLA